MNLTPNMRTILVAIFEEMRRLEAVGEQRPAGIDYETWRALWQEHREYLAYGVPYDLPRWLGRPASRSDSAVFSRAIRNLEAVGLVVRVNRYGGHRATHLRLTAEGRAAADRLLGANHQAEASNPPIDWSQVELPLIELPPEAVEPGGEGRNA